MTNYSNGLIKQIEDLTIENERLKEDNKSLKTESRALRQELRTLESSIEEMVKRAVEKATAPLNERIKHLEAENERKDKEIMRLKATIDKDSSNSSKPPSCNGFKKIPNSREKSDRKVGGQKGHDGKTLKIPENLDELVREGKAEKKLVDYSRGAVQYISQWTVDIAIKTVYTEKRYRIGTVKPCVSYGENIKALSVLLSNDGLIAEGRLSELFKEISGGLITISEATIEKINREAGQKINTDEIKEHLLNNKVMHVDETVIRCAQILENGEENIKTANKTTYDVIIRTYSNEKTTLCTVNPHKDDEGVKRDGILTAFCGILSHDHDKKYYKYSELHAICGAHLLRDLKGLFELYNIKWADTFRLFYNGINEYKKKTAFCDSHKLIEFEERYDALLADGYAVLNKIGEKNFGYTVLRPILNRLRDYKSGYMLFIRDYDAPFTNNQAERDLRPCKTKQKISGCFRSWNGLVCYAKIRSFLSTAKKRSVNLFDAFKNLLTPCPC